MTEATADTTLDGLKFALVIRSGKVMADGNWIFAGVVDERADEAQRQALAAIVGGQAGGPPAFIRENLVSDFRGVAYKPIEFDLDGLKRSTVIPDVLSFEIEGVASRNRSGEPFYIDNTAHPAGRRLALARAEGNACAWLWPRPRSRGEGQQRPFRAASSGRHKR